MPPLAFRTESEMSAPVARWMRNSGLQIKSEFSVPWGVCDLVGMEFDASRVRRRVSYGQLNPIGSEIRIAILALIPESDSGRSVSLRNLATKLSYLSLERLKRELQILQADRFVSRTDSGSFCKRNGWAPLQKRIVAIELKLSRVSEAIFQAESNMSFATHSYVALPGNLATRIAALRESELQATGIGVLAVWRTRCNEVLRAASRTSAHNEIIQSHVVERFWRTRGN